MFWQTITFLLAKIGPKARWNNPSTQSFRSPKYGAIQPYQKKSIIDEFSSLLINLFWKAGIKRLTLENCRLYKGLSNGVLKVTVCLIGTWYQAKVQVGVRSPAVAPPWVMMNYHEFSWLITTCHALWNSLGLWPKACQIYMLVCLYVGSFGIVSLGSQGPRQRSRHAHAAQALISLVARRGPWDLSAGASRRLPEPSWSLLGTSQSLSEASWSFPRPTDALETRYNPP